MSESGGRKALNELLHRHPAQRFNSPSRTISAALHATGLVSFVFSYKFLIENPNVMYGRFTLIFLDAPRQYELTLMQI